MDDDLLEDLIKRRDKLNDDIAKLVGEEQVETEIYYDLEQRVMAKPKEPKYMTGVDWLDREIGGFRSGTFVNLAGQSFSGKTSLALKILANVAEYNKAFLASLEMYENKLVDKLNHLSPTQKKNLIVSQKCFKIEELESIMRTQAKKGVKFFVLDSRMKLTVQQGEKEYQKIALLSGKLASLTQELGIIVILINQTSEEDLKNGRFSLKGSGDQFYDSDCVLFLAIAEDKKTGDEKRLCFCKKDRDNGKLWSCDITETQVQVMEYQEELTMEKI